MRNRGKWLALAMGGALIIPATAAILDSVLPARSAAINLQRLAAVAASQRSFTPEQRLAVRTEIQNEMNPRWKDLSYAQRAQRYAMIAKMMLRPRDVVTPAAAAFIGNQTMISDLSSDLIGLDRQSDCSLTLHKGAYTLSATLNPTIQFTSTTPGYERILHSASGVTSTSNVFASGCADPSIGLSTRRGVFLGTVQGKRLVAWEAYNSSQDKNALYYALVDRTATTVQNSSADYGLPNLLAITAGDLNGDGIADVVGVDQQNGAIAVWLAHADGTLSAATSYSVPGVTAESAVIADVNGDGKLDVVVASRDGFASGQEHVSVLTGKGDGTLNAPQTLDVPTPTGGPYNNAYGLTNLIAADVRGTGHPDLVGSNGLLLLNSGAGAFSVGTAAAFAAEGGSSNFVPSLAAGDFNKDGKLDLAISNGIDVRILLGAGNGSFSAGARYAATSAVGYVTATDIDGDGNPDLYLGLANDGVFAGDQFEPGQGYALMGNGDGTFQGAPALPFAYAGSNLADLNGDGKTDAVGVNSDGSFSTYLGDGKGAFALATTLSPASITSSTPSTVGALDSYALGDINGDGKQDLAFIVNGYVGPGFGPGIFIANGDGQGGFATSVFYAAPSTVGQIDSAFTISNIHLADLNKDGKADLIYNYSDSSGGANSTLYYGTVVQLSNGDGTFRAPQVIPYRSAAYNSNGINPTETALVALVTDLNKDGNPDLVFVAQSSSIDSTLSTYAASLQVALGHGDGTFGTPATVAGPDILVASFDHSTPPSVAVADMNGDGIPDLVALGSSSSYRAQVAVALGVGDGTFKTPTKTTYSAQYLNTAQGLAVGDFNGDGKADVAITDPYSSLGAGISLGNGDGTLQTGGDATTTVPSLSINVQASGGAIAHDFNGDGVADILAGNTLLLSQAAATSTPPPVTADFNLDASATSGSVTAGQSASVTLTLTPTGGFNQSVSLACSGLPAGAACSFSPASVPVSGTASTSTLTLTTTARTALNAPAGTAPWLPGGTLLAGFLIPVVWRRRQLARNAVVFAALAGLVLLGACHGHSNGGSVDNTGGGTGGGTTGTPAGATTVTITATAGSTTHSVSYQLTVS